jgi:hypothetical protein
VANIPTYLTGLEGSELYNDQLNQSLQDSISDDGFVMPSQPTSSIVTLSGMMPNGTIWYDQTTHELKARVNGSIVVIQTA